MIISLFSLLLFTHAAGTDYFPNFYGDYRIASWSCESTLKDTGCMSSARIVIERSGAVSAISVFDAKGSRIRWNELVEKGDAKNSYVLSGDGVSAAYTVEAKDSRGTRYFYNLLEIRRLENGSLQFTHSQESTLAGLTNTIKRVFALKDRL